MPIKLPKQFDELLKDKYRALVDTAASRYTEILVDNKLEFFKDYTDHGINHIQEVLETAAEIIDDGSFKILNEKDVSVLVIAVLLHDIGMHLSSEGLKKIISGDFEANRISEFDKLTWGEEWTSFFHEAKRFNDEQLRNIFGTVEHTIREPNIEDLNDNDRKLYGEFLRRFHHRLAHEIAKGGFPTKKGSDNILISSGDVDDEIIDLAGLVARSHGMPLRKATDYLENKYSMAWLAPHGVKAVFLMVVLRISDYLQIQSGRASNVGIKSKRFDSPVSKKEWEKHHSIRDINIKTADPERIFVIARPPNSIVYLELKKLFQDIQAELDLSWAILGEAYGKDEDLKNLKIKFRRIRSILDDEDQFNQNVNYVPERVFFNADPELLKLLIGPLYGDDPKYGVRELLQNSIDAIKERRYLCNRDGQVSITLKSIMKEKPRYEIIISDSGIGMTKDTLINYFFRAGASFRKSMTWKKNFFDEKESKIQKTGRFGVGVGDEFELSTKYDSTNSQGYYCKATLGMSQVELVKQDCPVGTTIKIILKESANALINGKISEFKENPNRSHFYEDKAYLEWFTWYLMDQPKVDYIIDEGLKSIFRFRNSNLQIASTPEGVTKSWRSFETKDYKKIHWTIDFNEPLQEFYDEPNFDHLEQLSCNGFKINRGYKIFDTDYKWRLPKISIFDNNANLPLSLSRDHIQDDRLPFEDDLLENISHEVIKTLLETDFNKIGPYYTPRQNLLKFVGDINLSDFVVVIDEEFTLLDLAVFEQLKVKSFVQLWIKPNARVPDKESLLFPPVYQATPMIYDAINFYKPILEGAEYNGRQFGNWFNLGWLDSNGPENSSFSRIYISSSKLDFLMAGKRLNKTFKDAITARKVGGGWSEITTSKQGRVRPSVPIKYANSEVYPLVIERFINAGWKNQFLIKAWKKYLGNEWKIPIDRQKRPSISKFGK